ncbi:MAG: HPr family phosphocarrier protein, partial [Candidatus Omnitrophica bacterium]|nr:HPr family phosphocarrier protein [Candidatus Omnitrophota bacterium]
MPVVSKKIVIKNKQGLHARPAALFVQTANKFDSTITVIKGKEEVNGKSIMGILMLGAEKDSIVIIR